MMLDSRLDCLIVELNSILFVNHMKRVMKPMMATILISKNNQTCRYQLDFNQSDWVGKLFKKYGVLKWFDEGEKAALFSFVGHNQIESFGPQIRCRIHSVVAIGSQDERTHNAVDILSLAVRVHIF